MEQKIILNVPNGKAKEFEAGLKDLLKECGGKISDIQVKDIFDTSKPIWERIKTVDDAIEYTGMTLPENISELPTDVQAMLKLRIVCAAYNELTADTLNEFPKFTEDEYRYYPWFCLYTQEEIDEMDEDDRSRVLGRSGNGASAFAGVAYSGTNYATSYSNTLHGGRLCFKKRELSDECGKRFIELWADFFLLDWRKP